MRKGSQQLRNYRAPLLLFGISLLVVLITGAFWSIPTATTTTAESPTAVHWLPLIAYLHVSPTSQASRTALSATNAPAPTATAPTATTAPPRNEFFVAPDGTGDGSKARPWGLATALEHPKAVQPGATIWLRDGTYSGTFRSRLQGIQSAPIVVRQFPNERATIGGSISIQGAWTTFWGFEVTNAGTATQKTNAVSVFGPHTKLINLVVHDNRGSGFGFWKEAVDSELYGCLIYNNGVSKFEHGIYAQGVDGTHRIVDTIVFNNASYGIHAYSGLNQYVKGMYLEGNVSFNNGWFWKYASDILIGGETSADDIQILRNYTYETENLLNTDLGYSLTANGSIVIQDNYFVGGRQVLTVHDWKILNLDKNTVIGGDSLVTFSASGATSPSSPTWNNNTYFDNQSAKPFVLEEQKLSFKEWQQTSNFDTSSQYILSHPTTNRVFIEKNQYEPGRANIIVYNWQLAPTVDVDVSGVLPIGTAYEVRDAPDYFGEPVAHGVYTGTPLRLPMQGLQPAEPTGDWVKTPAQTTPQFHVFVLVSEP